MNIQFPVTVGRYRQLNPKGYLTPEAAEFLASLMEANPGRPIDITYQGEVQDTVESLEAIPLVYVNLEVYCDVCGLHWTLEDPCPYH